MSDWIKVQSTRHQVAIVGVVNDAQNKRAIAGVEVTLEQQPESLTRWLGLKAIQHGDRWQTSPQLDRQWVALSPRVSLIRAAGRLFLLTRTAIDGYFYFEDLPAGDYQLAAALPSAGTRYGTARSDRITVTQVGNSIRRISVEMALPPTAIRGQVIDAKTSMATKPVGVPLATVQIKGGEATLSDREGHYLLTGLEVWAQSDSAPQPTITVSAQGYQSDSRGVWPQQGQVQIRDFSLNRT